MVYDFLNVLFPELRPTFLCNMFEIISVQDFTCVKQMYECVCVLISAYVLKKPLFVSLSVSGTQATHGWGSWRSSAARKYQKNACPWCRVLLERDIVQEHVTYYYNNNIVNNGCTFYKIRTYSGEILPVIIHVIRGDAIPISVCAIL
jgi:hypothetical protein